MELTFGIDLGTSRSCICTIIKQNPEMIPVGNSNLLPSFVSFKNGTCKVGDAAKQEFVGNSGNVVYNTKRLIGRKFSDKEVQEDIRNLHYNIKEGMDGGVLIELLEGELKTPVEIATLIMLELKKFAEQFAEKSGRNVVKKVVVCVPAYFSDKQRKDTESAAKNAEFEVLSLINEPTAAAIAYSYDKRDLERPTKMMVYDLGGGTFDVSIIKIEGGEIKVIGTGGDSHLGGEDFTNSLCDYIREKYEEETEESLRKKKDRIYLRKKCEKAKISLCDSSEAVVEINDQSYTITREKFAEINHNLFKRTIDIVIKTLKEVNMTPADIEEILLIGGASRMVQIPEYLNKVFPKTKICKDINPDEAVSQGAAILANEIIYNELIVVRDEMGEYMIARNDAGLDMNSAYKVIIDYKNHKGNVNYCVVEDKDKRIQLKERPEYGDKIMIPCLKYRPSIKDILSHSIGYEIKDDDGNNKMCFIFEKNKEIPNYVERRFKTLYDNQESVPVKIFEGEDEYTANNNKIDEFSIDGIPRRPKGQYIFKLKSSIDENGILDIKACDENERLLVIHRTNINNISCFK